MGTDKMLYCVIKLALVVRQHGPAHTIDVVNAQTHTHTQLFRSKCSHNIWIVNFQFIQF